MAGRATLGTIVESVCRIRERWWRYGKEPFAVIRFSKAYRAYDGVVMEVESVDLGSGCGSSAS